MISETVISGEKYMIKYKKFYNKDRGLLEPMLGKRAQRVQCPTCGSRDMKVSGSPDDPEEIFPYETVRCIRCGHITDWYEARKQFRYHYRDDCLEIERDIE